MQTRYKNEQKATILTDQEQLANLKDELHVPYFWTHVGWSSWSITNYDRVATKNILGLKRSRAHEFLKQDLTDVIKVLDPKGRRIQRARQMEKDLKKSYKDTYNLKFWRVYATPNTLSSLVHELAEEQFSTAAAKILGKRHIVK